jgi:hypothetical protein
VFYPPVVAYIAYLGLRFRDLTLFTAANPGIPASGFVGESKHDILQNLKDADWAIPRFTLIAEDALARRIARAEAFMEEQGLHFPVVLKPDAGQRGSGVVVARSSHQLGEYLSRASSAVILQEYVAGLEFGVFYVRYPGEQQGQVFSVTEKRMPVVTGDGRRTLEELILADERAVCMADFYLQKNASRLRYIPADGEPVQLVELGTHCRGAIFLDGSDAITHELESAIEKIARTFEGFYFGRFDIRVPSLEDFKAGKNLKVLELNGVTSEATHIYDPKFKLRDAYRILFRQWRMAFEIGRENRKRGSRSSSVAELLGMVLAYRKTAMAHPE